MTSYCCIIVTLIVLTAPSARAVEPILGPLTSEANGHASYLLAENVPEPSSLAFAAASGGLALVRRRRHRRK